jgi:hypothetical protein
MNLCFGTNSTKLAFDRLHGFSEPPLVNPNIDKLYKTCDPKTCTHTEMRESTTIEMLRNLLGVIGGIQAVLTFLVKTGIAYKPDDSIDKVSSGGDNTSSSTEIELMNTQSSLGVRGGGVKKKRGPAHGGSNDRRGGGDRGTSDERAMRTSGLQLYRGTLSHDAIALHQFDASAAAATARTLTRPIV